MNIVTVIEDLSLLTYL